MDLLSRLAGKATAISAAKTFSCSERSFRRVNKSEPTGSDGGWRGEAAAAK